ncbi:MAG: RDD family protein [Ferruginibacter sp.]
MENNLPSQEETNQVDYLANIDDAYFQFVHATTGQRFLNFLIDNILMRFGLSFLTGMVIGMALAAISPEFLNDAVAQGNTGGYFFILLLIGYLNYIVYYTLCEKLFKGYTLGKLITGTRAIREDGTELSFKDSLLRSLCRLVPFEALSGFGGHPWHDKWTKTMVIKSR